MPDALPRLEDTPARAETHVPESNATKPASAVATPFSTAIAPRPIEATSSARGASRDGLGVVALQLGAGLVFTGITYAVTYGVGWGLAGWCASGRDPNEEIDFPVCDLFRGFVMLMLYGAGTLWTPLVAYLAGRSAGGTGRATGTILGSLLMGGLTALITSALTQPDGPFVSTERLVAVAASISFGTLGGAIAGYQLTTDAAMRLWVQPTPDRRGALLAIGGAL